MDFKTKRKVIIMKRKFEHTDIAMIGIPAAIIGLIVFNLITKGIGDSYVFMF